MSKTIITRHIHLICNAHLDPVWLWEWPEGAAEAMSTFRVAAELCEKESKFIFNHNEVTLYKWIQEYEPSLFKRIQKLVKAGRWHIMGGWYLQPDCNMPSGESFVRQILLGKAYFKKYFGVEPTTAINFDSFGHTRGLVQILAKSDYDSYLFGRPQSTQTDLPGEEFIWVGYDGSEVMGTRFRGWYNTALGEAAELISQRIKDAPDQNPLAVLWGVGNHGGGPSKKDLCDVNKLIEETGECYIEHSNPEAYFKQLKKHRRKLPRYKGDINPFAIGCYSSMALIKQQHRRVENELYSLEKMASAAAVNGLAKYPYEEIHGAMCDLMFSQFHDILPGSSIAPAESAALEMLGHGLENISKLKTSAFFALASGQKKAKNHEIPIMVYNPHPFKTVMPLECEFNLADFNLEDCFHQIELYKNGKKVLCQVEKEQSNLYLEWRKRVAFYANLEPSQMNRFDCRLKILKKKPPQKLKSYNGKIFFKTKELKVIINTKTGLIDRYEASGTNIVDKDAFCPLVIADNSDPWGMTVNSFRKVIGRFKLMSKEAGTRFSGIHQGKIDSVRIIEDGPVRSVVEAVFAYGDSFICQQYKLPKIGTEIEIEVMVHWNEKDKMLKLSVPIINHDCEYVGQFAYGNGELPINGNEAVSQKWVAIVSKKEKTALTCINDSIYGSDFSSNGLRLTLLRSPAYSAHVDENGKTHLLNDRYTPRIDQGYRSFRFWFNVGKMTDRLNKIDREALVRNEKPFVLSFFPPGIGKKPKTLAELSDNVVQITAIKRAQSNNDLIVRLFEPTGRRRKTVLSLPFMSKKIQVEINGFEIKTLRVNPRTRKITEVNLLERKI